jgi:hypothetical protein
MIPVSKLLTTPTVSKLLGDPAIALDGDIESLDLTAAALAEADPMMERSRLVSRGFVHAQFGRWETGLGDVVTITVYEFADAAQAVFSVSDIHESLRAAGGRIQEHTPTTSSVSLLTHDDAIAYESLVYTMACGSFQVVVATTAGPSTFDWASIHAIAEAQSNRLKK